MWAPNYENRNTYDSFQIASSIDFIYLQFIDEVIKLGGIEAKENNSENTSIVELGSTLEIEIHAEGVPGLIYQWLKLPPGEICVIDKML